GCRSTRSAAPPARPSSCSGLLVSRSSSSKTTACTLSFARISFRGWSGSFPEGLHLVGEVADHREAETLTVDALHDGHDADDEEGDPNPALDDDHAATKEWNPARDEAEHEEEDPADDLGDQDRQTVLRVPLNFAVVFLGDERDDAEDPEIREDDHQGAVAAGRCTS